MESKSSQLSSLRLLGGIVLRVINALLVIAGSTAALYAQCNYPPCYPYGSAPYLPPDVGAEYVWDYTSCSWVMEPCSEAGCSSPIVIDTDGTGFHLTSAADGVMFDFYGDGRPIKIAWTEKGSSTGWLALPRNGKISSARDLFGNLTAQPLTNSIPPNGFAALAVYDSPGYGGNSDGVIDAKDVVWSQLRVWIDVNHDGVAQPEELHTLEEVGIKGILLRYERQQYTDSHGNQFRYKGHLIPTRNDQVDRRVFDVFLATH